MVSDSKPPTRHSYEKTSNDIPWVNIYPLFLPAINCEFQFPNHHCDPNSYQDNLITNIQYQHILILVHI